LTVESSDALQLWW